MKKEEGLSLTTCVGKPLNTDHQSLAHLSYSCSTLSWKHYCLNSVAAFEKLHLVNYISVYAWESSTHHTISPLCTRIIFKSRHMIITMPNNINQIQIHSAVTYNSRSRPKRSQPSISTPNHHSLKLAPNNHPKEMSSIKPLRRDPSTSSHISPYVW